MSTAEFQRKFDFDELGDTPEWFDWDGYSALAADAQKKPAELEDGGAWRGGYVRSIREN